MQNGSFANIFYFLFFQLSIFFYFFFLIEKPLLNEKWLMLCEADAQLESNGNKEYDENRRKIIP